MHVLVANGQRQDDGKEGEGGAENDGQPAQDVYAHKRRPHARVSRMARRAVAEEARDAHHARQHPQRSVDHRDGQCACEVGNEER